MNKAESPPPPLPPWLTGKQGKQSRTSRTTAQEASVNQCSVPGRNFFEVNSDLVDPLIHEPAPPLPP